MSEGNEDVKPEKWKVKVHVDGHDPIEMLAVRSSRVCVSWLVVESTGGEGCC